VALVGCGAPPRPWWEQGGTGVTSCGDLAVYQVAGVIHGRSCPGILSDPAQGTVVGVGSDIDVHVTEEESATAPGPVSIMPIPQSSNSSVLRRVSVSDGGSSATYRAQEPGTVQLLTRMFCWHTATTTETEGTCPLLTVTVRG
jgi:hypothetical protein